MAPSLVHAWSCSSVYFFWLRIENVEVPSSFSTSSHSFLELSALSSSLSFLSAHGSTLIRTGLEITQRSLNQNMPLVLPQWLFHSSWLSPFSYRSSFKPILSAKTWMRYTDTPSLESVFVFSLSLLDFDSHRWSLTPWQFWSMKHITARNGSPWVLWSAKPHPSGTSRLSSLESFYSLFILVDVMAGSNGVVSEFSLQWVVALWWSLVSIAELSPIPIIRRLTFFDSHLRSPTVRHSPYVPRSWYTFDDYGRASIASLSSLGWHGDWLGDLYTESRTPHRLSWKLTWVC